MSFLREIGKKIIGSYAEQQLRKALDATDTPEQKLTAVNTLLSLTREDRQTEPITPDLVTVFINHTWGALPKEVRAIHFQYGGIDQHFYRPGTKPGQRNITEWSLNEITKYAQDLKAKIT